MEKIEKIGYGSYGNMFKVKKDGVQYALKQNFRITNAIGTPIIREMSSLLFVRNHPCFSELVEIYPRKPCELPKVISEGDSEDIFYFQFSLEHIDLYTYLYLLESPVKHILKIITDIALGLEYLHKNGMVHLDLKPGNVLINLGKTGYNTKVTNGNKIQMREFVNRIDTMSITAKICDLGFCKSIFGEIPTTPNVMTLFYRAPEILVKKEHGEKADVWSFGALIFEIIYRKCLYETASEIDEEELRALIVHKRPTLTTKDKEYLKLPEKLITSGNPKDRCPFSETSIESNRKRIIESSIFGGDFQEIDNLLGGMLQINPKDRPTITEILDLPMFDDLRSYIEETRKVRFPEVIQKIVIPKVDTRDKMYQFYMTYISPLVEAEKATKAMFFLGLDIMMRCSEGLSLESLDDSELFYVVITTFYIAYKYYSSFIRSQNAFIDSFSIEMTQEIVEKIETCEVNILKLCVYQVYSKTIWDFIPDKSKEKIQLKDAIEFLKSLSPGEHDSNDISRELIKKLIPE